MQRFADLEVWQRAHKLVHGVYAVTRSFPRDELFGLTSQLRRAAVSIAANIVEGSKRTGRTDFARFLNIAEGSAGEVEYFLQLSGEFGFVSAADVEPLKDSVRAVAQMLFRLRSRVEATEAQQRTHRREGSHA